MGPKTKASRRDHWKGYNFAGTIDWAVDLQDFSDDGSIEIDKDGDVTVADWDSWDPDDVPPNFKYGDCKEKSYDTLEDLANDSSTDKNCRPFYVLQYLQKNLTDSLTAYDKLIEDDYDDKFKTYSKAVVDGAPKDVNSFVKDHGNKYFTCEVTEMQFCKSAYLYIIKHETTDKEQAVICVIPSAAILAVARGVSRMVIVKLVGPKGNYRILTGVS